MDAPSRLCVCETSLEEKEGGDKEGDRAQDRRGEKKKKVAGVVDFFFPPSSKKY